MRYMHDWHDLIEVCKDLRNIEDVQLVLWGYFALKTYEHEMGANSDSWEFDDKMDDIAEACGMIGEEIERRQGERVGGQMQMLFDYKEEK